MKVDVVENKTRGNSKTSREKVKLRKLSQENVRFLGPLPKIMIGKVKIKQHFFNRVGMIKIN